eukprot:GHRR01033335.1.p1 GENE.GHRR01033335.1~~GHRR01033335.1.p1  ORF type:complete len:102 (-),score=27.69 GHRR01033335.1:966-1271(-)
MQPRYVTSECVGNLVITTAKQYSIVLPNNCAEGNPLPLNSGKKTDYWLPDPKPMVLLLLVTVFVAILECLVIPELRDELTFLTALDGVQHFSKYLFMYCIC